MTGRGWAGGGWEEDPVTLSSSTQLVSKDFNRTLEVQTGPLPSGPTGNWSVVSGTCINHRGLVPSPVETCVRVRESSRDRVPSRCVGVRAETGVSIGLQRP